VLQQRKRDHTRVSAERCQSKRISCTKDCNEEVEEVNCHLIVENRISHVDK